MSEWKVITGDARDVLPTLSGADAIITDPPFGINFAGRPTKWQREAGMVATTWDESAPDVYGLLTLAPIVVIWGGNYFPLPLSRGWMAWHKPDSPPSMGNLELAWTNLDQNARSIVHSISATNAERVGHPTQKPLRVMKWCLEMAGIPVGATVIDPYCGSGTTGVACMQTGRNFIGIEIDPDYADIARRRIGEAANHLFVEPTRREPDPTMFGA